MNYHKPILVTFFNNRSKRYHPAVIDLHKPFPGQDLSAGVPQRYKYHSHLPEGYSSQEVALMHMKSAMRHGIKGRDGKIAAVYQEPLPWNGVAIPKANLTLRVNHDTGEAVRATPMNVMGI